MKSGKTLLFSSTALLMVAGLAHGLWQRQTSLSRNEAFGFFQIQTARAATQDSLAQQKKTFIAIFSLGPAWNKDKPAHEQAHFKEHSANLKRLRQEKKLLVGARYSDKGMIIIEAANEEEARAQVENDPMVVNGLFHLELYPFNAFYKGCIENP